MRGLLVLDLCFGETCFESFLSFSLLTAQGGLWKPTRDALQTWFSQEFPGPKAQAFF
jgi:hypothetical protein